MRLQISSKTVSGDLWVGTVGGGLNRLGPSTGRFSALPRSEHPAEPG